jgi:hypothetical protein
MDNASAYMEIAAHQNTETVKKNAARLSTDESAKKRQFDVDAQYQRALAAEGLRDEDLGFSTIVNRSSAVLIGFFSSFLYSQVAGVMSNTKTWQLAAVSLSVTLIALAVQRFYLRTVGAASFAVSRSWASVWMQFMHFFTIVMVFLTTNYGLALFTDMTSTAQLTWFEAIAMVYVSMLSVFYLLVAYKKSVS